LRRDLRNLESSLNEAAAMKPGQSQQLSRLIEAQNGLENQLRPSLDEMRILSENIQRIWNGDSALRSDLNDRVDGMGRQIEELKMKLESVKKAAEVSFLLKTLSTTN
jgi:archaellum component FlaC